MCGTRVLNVASRPWWEVVVFGAEAESGCEVSRYIREEGAVVWTRWFCQDACPAQRCCEEECLEESHSA